MSKLLGIQELLQKDSLQIKKVELSRGHVFVREMSGTEKDRWEKSMRKTRRTGDPKNPIEYDVEIEGFRAKLACATLCDAEGNLLFQMKDYPKLNDAMSAANLNKIVEAAQKLNAISEEDKEEIVKNSEAAQSGNSDSDSVSN